jgi:hypothetical protein
MAQRPRERYWVHSAPDDTSDTTACARGTWCLDRSVTTEQGERVITPAQTARVFCDSCERDVSYKLGELPGLALLLAVSIGIPAQGSVAIRVPFGPKLPIRADVDALLRLAVDVAVSWQGRVAAAERLTPVDIAYARSVALTRGPLLVRRAVQVLEGRIPALLALGPARMSRPAPIVPVLPGTELPDTITTTGAFESHDLDGAWAGNEIIRVHHLARAAVGVADPKPARLPGVPCRRRSCDAFTLRRAPLPDKPEDTAYWSECDVCGDLMTDAEYRSWTKRYAIYASSGVLPDE